MGEGKDLPNLICCGRETGRRYKACPGVSPATFLSFPSFLLFAASLQKYLVWPTTVMDLGVISIWVVDKIVRVEEIPPP